MCNEVHLTPFLECDYNTWSPLPAFSLKPALIPMPIFPTIWQPDVASLTWLEIPAIGITLVVRPERRQCCFQNPLLNCPQVGCGRRDGAVWVGEDLFLSPVNINGHLVSKLGRGLVQNFKDSSLEGTREGRYGELRKVTYHYRCAAWAILPPTENPTQVAYKFPRSINPQIYSQSFDI